MKITINVYGDGFKRLLSILARKLFYLSQIPQNNDSLKQKCWLGQNSFDGNATANFSSPMITYFVQKSLTFTFGIFQLFEFWIVDKIFAKSQNKPFLVLF